MLAVSSPVKRIKRFPSTLFLFGSCRCAVVNVNTPRRARCDMRWRVSEQMVLLHAVRRSAQSWGGIKVLSLNQMKQSRAGGQLSVSSSSAVGCFGRGRYARRVHEGWGTQTEPARSCWSPRDRLEQLSVSQRRNVLANQTILSINCHSMISSD